MLAVRRRVAGAPAGAVAEVRRAAARLAAGVRRHPYHMGLAALAAGLALSPARPELAALSAGLAAAVAALAGAPRLAVASAVLLFAGTAVGAARLAPLDAPSPATSPGTRVEARAVLAERPRPTRFGSRAVIELVSGEARGRRLVARAGHGVAWPPAVDAGTELVVAGVASRPRRRPGAGFDYAAYLRRRGIDAELTLRSVRATGRRRGGLTGVIDDMRRRAEHRLAAGLGPGEAALARGMVLGQDEAIERPTVDDFRRAGLGHLLAVSGQNVMLLCALGLPLLAGLGLGFRARVAGLLVLIALYVPLAGAGPSLQRAGVMGAAGLVALAAGRPASRWYALLLAAVVTLGVNPRTSEEPGWQLSFAAVAGILSMAPSLRRPLRGLPRPLAEGLAVTVAATIATGPLVAYHFGTVSLVALPANVLALPVVAPIMWCGLVQTGLAQLTALPGPLGPLLVGAVIAVAEVLGSLNGLLLGYLAALARWFAEVPGAQVNAPLASPLLVAALYGLIGAAALGIRRAARRAEPLASSGAAAWRRLSRRRRAGLGLAAVAALGFALWRAGGPAPSPDELTVSFLDVGQGDATLVQHPAGGAVLFDGGPAEARVTRLLKAAGVRRLSAIVATHQSADHQGGLSEVLERFPVDLLLEGGDGTLSRDFRAMLATADRRRVRRVRAVAGQTLRAGGLTIRILSPPPRPPGPPPEDPNPRAVVATVSAGDFDLFLAADAESPSLLPLALPDVDAMKVSHHGSRDAGLPALLHRLRPQVAAIEVGAGNTYGHPTPETLRALAAAVPHVYRTDQDGTIKVKVGGGALRVETER